VTGIVPAGISTSIGVESTARAAWERGYELAVATDAVTDTVAAAHDVSVGVILLRLGQLDTTAAVIAALPTS
jgi:nicotinamidase-related amidase